MPNSLEDGLVELLTNELVNMNKQEIILDGIVSNNYIRVISFEEWDWDYDADKAVLVNKSYKLQIKISGFLTTRYHTIKNWDININDELDDELAKNEATELFNNLINPYKCHGEF